MESVAATSLLHLGSAAREAYRRWGVPERFAANGAVTTAEALSEILSAAEERIPEFRCRIAPSLFDADNEDLRAFPRPVEWRWSAGGRALRSGAIRGVITRLPAFWQFNISLYRACREVGVPLFTNEPENIPVGAMALASGAIDAVVTESRDAAAFAAFISERALPAPKLGVFIHRADGEWLLPDAVKTGWGTMLQEVHALPGVPSLTQCTALAERKKPHFHLSDAYYWEISATETLITSAGDDPLPLFRYALPCKLERVGECSCGTAIFQRTL